MPARAAPLTDEQRAARTWTLIAFDVETDRALVEVRYPGSLEVHFMRVKYSRLPELVSDYPVNVYCLVTPVRRKEDDATR